MKNIGIIGCGNILETYLRSENYFNNLNFTVKVSKLISVQEFVHAFYDKNAV